MKSSTKWRWALGLVLAGALGSSACGDDDDNDSCGALVELPCNIREAACRCSVFAATKRVRDQPEASLPPSRVITREQYAAETRASSGSGMPSEALQVYQDVLKLLSLLPTDTSLDDAETDAQISGVAAYYDSEEKKVTIIDDAAEKELDGVFTLSHEYVHALQDQREVISKQFDREQSTDGLLSVKTLIEGEAVLVSDLVLFDVRKRTFDASALGVFDELFEATLMSIGMSPAPLTEAQLALAYPVGASTLAKAYLARGMGGVASFYENRPTSVTGWLDESKAPTLPGRLTCLPPEAPTGYKDWGMDRLGATAMIALGATLDFDTEEMNELATGWSNDLFALYSLQATRAVAVAWRIGFSNDTATTLLETRLRQSATKLEVSRAGNELLIVGASDPAALAAWSTRNACRAAKSRELPTTPLGPDFTRFIAARLRSQHRHHAVH